MACNPGSVGTIDTTLATCSFASVMTTFNNVSGTCRSAPAGAALWTDRSSYQPGDDLVVGFERPNDATAFDWVGIFTCCSDVNKEWDWLYTCNSQKTCNASLTGGNITFSGLALDPGTYVAKFFTDDSYVVLASSFFTFGTAPAQFVNTNGNDYEKGPVYASFGRATGATAADWVGMYPLGSAPTARNSSVAWAYVCDAKNPCDASVQYGAVPLDPVFPTSTKEFVIYLFSNDTMNIVAESAIITLTVVAPPAPLPSNAFRFNGTDVNGTAQQGTAVAMSDTGSTVVVGGSNDSDTRGAFWVYQRDAKTADWQQQGPKYKCSSTDAKSACGHSVAISGDGYTSLVSAPQGTATKGAGMFFELESGEWKEIAKVEGAENLFGESVSLSSDGTTALIGSPSRGATGAAAVFVRDGPSSWTAQGDPLVGTGAVGGQQGKSVALSSDGNTAVIGSPADDGNKGAVWVFSRSNDKWTQVGGKLTGKDLVGEAQQGAAVAVSSDGSTIVVGGPGDNATMGGVWVFARDANGAYLQQGGKLTVPQTRLDKPAFGNSVAVTADGARFVAGAKFDDNGYGGGFVFTRTGAVWSQVERLTVNLAAPKSANRLGWSSAISADGDELVLGAPLEGAGSKIGAAYVFENLL